MFLSIYAFYYYTKHNKIYSKIIIILKWLRILLRYKNQWHTGRLIEKKSVFLQIQNIINPTF